MFWEFPLFIAIFATVLFVLNAFSATRELDYEDDAPQPKNLLGRVKSFFLTPFAALNSYLPLPGYRRYVQRMLVRSGDTLTTFEMFMARQEMLAILCPLLVAIAIDSFAPDILMALALLGAFVPIIRQDAACKRRMRSLKRELPYFMDLLTLSVEAGADFAFAISRIVDGLAEGPMRQEMMLLTSRLKSGNSRRQAITRLAERVDLPDMRSLCSAMIQADETGTSLVSVLRAQSAFITQRQTEEWREKAKKASTKIMIPLVLFIFPTMFLIIIGPVALKLLEIFFGNG